MRYLVSIALLAAAIIHLLPLLGVAGPQALARLYGTTVEEPNLIILMRHRAVLFGLLGVFLVAAAFVRPLQIWALLAGMVSVGSFIALASSVGSYNAAVARVVTVDWVALALLVIGLLAWTYERWGSATGA